MPYYVDQPPTFLSALAGLAGGVYSEVQRAKQAKEERERQESLDKQNAAMQAAQLYQMGLQNAETMERTTGLGQQNQQALAAGAAPKPLTDKQNFSPQFDPKRPHESLLAMAIHQSHLASLYDRDPSTQAQNLAADARANATLYSNEAMRYMAQAEQTKRTSMTIAGRKALQDDPNKRFAPHYGRTGGAGGRSYGEQDDAEQAIDEFSTTPINGKPPTGAQIRSYRDQLLRGTTTLSAQQVHAVREHGEATAAAADRASVKPGSQPL